MVAPDTEFIDVDAHTQYTLLENILDTLEEPALLTSAQGDQEAVVLYANRAAQAYFGRSFHQLVGQSPTDLLLDYLGLTGRALGATWDDDLGNWEVAPIHDHLGNGRFQVIVRTEAPASMTRRF